MVKPGSSKVITKQRFVGPYVIKEIVVGRPDVGQAYRLIDKVTGKEHNSTAWPLNLHTAVYIMLVETRVLPHSVGLRNLFDCVKI